MSNQPFIRCWLTNLAYDVANVFPDGHFSVLLSESEGNLHMRQALLVRIGLWILRQTLGDDEFLQRDAEVGAREKSGMDQAIHWLFQPKLSYNSLAKEKSSKRTCQT